MKERRFYGLIALIVVTAFSVIACDSSPEEKEINPFKGTWLSNDGYTAIFEDSSWHVIIYTGGVGLKGTYTHTFDTAHITYTGITEDGTNWRPLNSSELAYYVNTATISGNRLTWGITTYTRQ